MEFNVFSLILLWIAVIFHKLWEPCKISSNPVKSLTQVQDEIHGRKSQRFYNEKIYNHHEIQKTAKTAKHNEVTTCLMGRKGLHHFD